jgi:hypothetical protein
MHLWVRRKQKDFTLKARYSFVPHSPQKFVPEGFFAPHFEQTFMPRGAPQSLQNLPEPAGFLYFLLSFLISEVSLLLPLLVIFSLRNTLIALLIGVLYSIIINLVLFNFFIKRAGKTLSKREYLVTA